jgi:nicotinamidase-related amidase
MTSSHHRAWPTMPDAASLELPEPVGVRVDPTTTALVVMDITDPLCTNRPDCMESVPAISTLLGRARSAKAAVVHTIGPKQPTEILEQVGPLETEPVISGRADKFFDTDLDVVLEARGARTLVMVGTASNGAVMYTAFAANLRGYTVAVAGDAISSGNGSTNAFVLWQLVNQPGYWNKDNEPLLEGRVTLTTTDRIEFT